MQVINLTNLKRLMHYYYNLRIPLALWGKPSTAKTSMFRQFAQETAKKLGLKYSEDEFGPDIFTFKIIILSQFDAVDLRGVPYLSNEETRFSPASCLPRIGQGILFLDEISNVDPTLVAPVQQLMLEGRIENLVLPKDAEGKDCYWRVCAGNRSEDYCLVNEMSLAFLRRTAHFTVEPDLEEIINYFLDKEIDSRVIGYLKENPQDLFPKVINETLIEKKANPFPYTWEMVGRMIKKANKMDIKYIVSSWVGEDVGIKFWTFTKLYGKFSLDAIMKNPEVEIAKIIKDPQKNSLFYAIISSFSSLWWRKDKRLTPSKVVEILVEFPKEMQIVFMSMIIRKRTLELTSRPELQSVLKELAPYVNPSSDEE